MKNLRFFENYIVSARTRGVVMWTFYKGGDLGGVKFFAILRVCRSFYRQPLPKY